MSGSDYDPNLEAIYDRLTDLREDVDHEEFQMGRPMRLHQLADTSESLDEVSDQFGEGDYEDAGGEDYQEFEHAEEGEDHERDEDFDTTGDDEDY